MIKINETTVNELLHQLRTTFEFDYDNDLVSIAFYADRQTDKCKIGCFVSLNSIGEYLLESKVKGFKYEKTSSVHEIVVIINK